MPSSKKKPTKNRLIIKKKTISSALIILLVIVCAMLSTYIYCIKNDNAKANSTKVSWGSYVNLNSLQFNIVNGKGTLRTDKAFNDIKTFLYKESTNSRCGASGAEGAGYFTIKAWTSDQKQLLLGYGCASTDAQMYAVNTNNEWKTVSPTNHFDIFGIPDCEYLTQNNISPEIAPVCANGLNLESGTITGNPKYLNRTSLLQD